MSPKKLSIGWLTFFFGFAYFLQHFAQTGFLAQSMKYYFMVGLGMETAEVSSYMSIMLLPWLIKPLYGLFSDFVPLFGYRRKSYLLLLNLLAAGGFLFVAKFTTPGAIIFALTVTAFGTAASDVLIDALMVELGKDTGATKRFQAMQWLWFNIAAALSSFFGGLIAEQMGPLPGLHATALITAVAPLLLVVAVWFIIQEEKSTMNIAQLKTTVKSLWQACFDKTLWVVALFLAFWQFSPSAGDAIYYHQTVNLHFTQTFIGLLGTVSFAGSAIGALLFRMYMSDRYSNRQLMYASVVLGVLGTLGYLLISDNSMSTWLEGYIEPTNTALILYFVTGITNVVAFLTTLNIAADACPKNLEGLTFALLMSVFNLAMQGSQLFGGYLYSEVLSNSLSPLIWVSAGFTLVCWFLIPRLPASVLDGKAGED